MSYLFGLIGLYLGAVIDFWEGAVFGGCIGFLTGMLIRYGNRISKLEAQVAQIREPLAGKARVVAAGELPSVTEPQDQAPSAPATTIDQIIEQPVPPVPVTPVTVTTESAPAAMARKTEPDAPRDPTYFDTAIELLKHFFTTGNVVVKVGVIVLFFGVAFLLKYAVDRNAFPIELRLASVATGAIIMLIIGWRLRHKKQKYALVIQGGAVGVLYLTVFSAAKLYPFLPLTLAFIIMVALVVFSCVLAVLQDSRSLAVFATVGGFLAPVLISTGTGNHIALFSYYALLNAGIFGIAWHKAWRILNWVGFAFTFVIASLWGHRSYQPEFFNTTEPFLILFFLFYVAISTLYALKQPPHLRGLVDGTLVFGTPLIGFTLQNSLVRDFEFGLALSAVTVSAVYIFLAKLLWKKQISGIRLLTEAYLSLGVIFASLAIPFALDGRWTAAAWAVEGAGMTWIGIRQNRLLPRIFGLLLHVGSALAFITVIATPRGDLAIFNSAYIGCLLISLGGLFSGLQSWRYRDRLRAEEQLLHVALLIWGLCWWFGAGISEIDMRVLINYEMNVTLLFIAASMVAVFLLGRRLRWPAAEQPPYLLLPIMIIIALYHFVDGYDRNPFAYLGLAAWIAAFAAQYGLLWRCEKTWPEKLVRFWHAGALWLLIFMIARVIAYYINHAESNLENWGDVIWGLVPASVTAFVLYFKNKLPWPVQRFPNSYLGDGLFPVIAFIALWTILICGNEGNPQPLPYIPVLNPQDIVQVFAMLVMLDWWQEWKKKTIPGLAGLDAGAFLYVIATIAFIWLSAVVAHAVHFYGGVSYRLNAMPNSELFQTSISIVWTLTSFTVMGIATRANMRKLWFAGAALLAVVVCKLFMIDLEGSGTVTRIVSFTTVGILMLIIGYFSPLPPKQKLES